MKPEEIAFARHCGVDGIISNYPERLAALNPAGYKLKPIQNFILIWTCKNPCPIRFYP